MRQPLRLHSRPGFNLQLEDESNETNKMNTTACHETLYINGTPQHQSSQSSSSSSSKCIAPNKATKARPKSQVKPGMTKEAMFQNITSADIKHLKNIGSGSSGTVQKVIHIPTGDPMAIKRVQLSGDILTSKQVGMEMSIMKKCASKYIIEYYGVFMQDSEVVLCMEYMNYGSLEYLYKSFGAFPEQIACDINAVVVDALSHLKTFGITHRDIKPSNILVNSSGEVKVCDFGVSGTLVNSIADSFVGTSLYMSPERVLGESYTDAADVWALGLTLIELLEGRFPIVKDSNNDPSAPAVIFESLSRIVDGPAPKLDQENLFSTECVEYVKLCMQKDYKLRIRVLELSKQPFYRKATRNPSTLLHWVLARKKIIDEEKRRKKEEKERLKRHKAEKATK